MVKVITLLASVIFASLAHCAPPSQDAIDGLLADAKVGKLLDTMSTNVDQVMRRAANPSIERMHNAGPFEVRGNIARRLPAVTLL
jgi:hypothetical protein